MAVRSLFDGLAARRCLWLALALVPLLLSACGEGEQEWQDWPRRSELGLSFAVPPGREVEVRARSIVLRQPATYRNIDVIELYPGELPTTIREGDPIEEKADGSSGARYTLSLRWKMLFGLHVSMLAVIETEDGEPGFEDAWAVWDSLSAAE